MDLSWGQRLGLELWDLLNLDQPSQLNWTNTFLPRPQHSNPALGFFDTKSQPSLVVQQELVFNNKRMHARTLVLQWCCQAWHVPYCSMVWLMVRWFVVAQTALPYGSAQQESTNATAQVCSPDLVAAYHHRQMCWYSVLAALMRPRIKMLEGGKWMEINLFPPLPPSQSPAAPQSSTLLGVLRKCTALSSLSMVELEPTPWCLS